MLGYSLLLTLALVLSSPWWLLRMVTTQRYREGLRQRVGALPTGLLHHVTGQRVVWVHAVSVGEVLAASRLVAELETALGSGWTVVLSTTTRTGQALARQRFGADRVFYYPLDFAFAVRSYLHALKPAALILMESELWPRMLHECQRRGIPVAVANARVSDRSFRRTRRFAKLWLRMGRHVTLWAAQSKDDANRLRWLGIEPKRIIIPGNLKFDIRAPRESRMPDLIRTIADGRPILVAGSTVATDVNEEQFVLDAWRGKVCKRFNMLLVIAPRHPERFDEVIALAAPFGAVRATDLMRLADTSRSLPNANVVVLDTVGDLAAVYETATLAFVGGSMVAKGGHNPLEPAQFGVPIIMGTSWENFRDIVHSLASNGGLKYLPSDDAHSLESALLTLLDQPEYMARVGKAARRVFENQQGATARTVGALVELLHGARP